MAPLFEFCFSEPDWAATDPIDPGTRQVLSGGCRILFDPEHLFGHLVKCAA
jgi:hypothetical protein